jgi:hypothetical protein
LLPSVSMVSSVSTSSHTAVLFETHARFVDECAQRRHDVNMHIDDLKGLGNDLWQIHDSYIGNDGP